MEFDDIGSLRADIASLHAKLDRVLSTLLPEETRVEALGGPTDEEVLIDYFRKTPGVVHIETVYAKLFPGRAYTRKEANLAAKILEGMGYGRRYYKEDGKTVMRWGLPDGNGPTVSFEYAPACVHCNARGWVKDYGGGLKLIRCWCCEGKGQCFTDYARSRNYKDE